MSKARTTNQFRIIGGQWRSRRLDFPDSPGLRPSPDRVRETLFNWLASVIGGARCLDLFAGSGALGLEALSRGAGTVTFVDHDRTAGENIRRHLTTLQVKQAEVVHADMSAYLSGEQEPYEIVFLDPPFNKDLINPCLAQLAAHQWVVPGGWVYLESERRFNPDLPSGWVMERDKQTGQLAYRLVRTPA